jgi:hypothetical protein
LGANENSYRCDGTSQAAPRVGVVVPDAPDPLAALEDGDVVVAGALQHGHRADAAEASADDGDRG